jgi:peptide/nickel transport system ATP-binding protein
MTQVKASNASEPILSIRDLRLSFKTSRGELDALVGVSLDVRRGEMFGIVGETGCGKTVVGLSVLRLLPSSATITKGSIVFDGADLLKLSTRQTEDLRGSRIAMIFQDPSTSLNPVFTVGTQIIRVIRQHTSMSAEEARDRAGELLESVGLADVTRILDTYPHQLSGGMQQRVMIAMALSCSPALLIADEPTTSLDVTIQAQFLELLRMLQQELGLSIIFITHNLGIVAELCDRVAVLYAGRVVEHGTTQEIYTNPRHPYTQGLIGAIPRPDIRGSQLAAIPGSVPANPGKVRGCAFAPRCPHVYERCRTEIPPEFAIDIDHYSACFLNDPEDEHHA